MLYLHLIKIIERMKHLLDILVSLMVVALLWADDAEEVRSVGNRGGTGI